MTIQLSPLPPPRRTLPGLAGVVALAFVVVPAAVPEVRSADDSGAFTGRYELGVPVYRLAPIEVTAARSAKNVVIASRGNARETPHADSATECLGPTT